jgi:hypothetical protein
LRQTLLAYWGTIVLSILFPFIWQAKEKAGKIESERIAGIIYGVLRYAIAFNLCRFGWIKLFGLQFNVPLEIAKQPMNQVSGEWLTWFYFGHSKIFSFIVSLIQIGGAYMLLFRRTLLFGLIVLFSFMVNLTLINIFYEMNLGALLQSVLLTVGILYLILLDYKKLLEFFFKTKSNLPTVKWPNEYSKLLLRLSIVLLPLIYTLYLKYFLN